MRFDEGTGTIVADFSNHGSTGILGNNNASRMPAWVTGKSGKALKFDGIDDIVRVSDNPVFDKVFDEGTVVAWIRVEDRPSNPAQIGQIVFSLSPRLEFAIVIDDLRLGLPDQEVFVADKALTQNNIWYHVTDSWSNRSNFHRGYVNGILGNSYTQTIRQSGLTYRNFCSIKNIHA